MSRTKVSKLIRVQQGKSTIEFELEDTKLTINIFKQGSAVPPNKITIQEEAINVLKAMLDGPMLPLAKLASKLPPDTRREGNPPVDHTLSEEELAKGAEHPIEGMG